MEGEQAGREGMHAAVEIVDVDAELEFTCPLSFLILRRI